LDCGAELYLAGVAMGGEKGPFWVYMGLFCTVSRIADLFDAGIKKMGRVL
jgi:hypothetical protein